MTPKSCAAVSGGAAGEAAGRVGSAAGGTSEDEDSDSRQEAISYQERRREAHTFAEQKRRDSIRRGYDMLQELVPACHATSSTASCSPLPSNSLTNSGGEEECQPAASPPSTAGAAVKLSKACVLQKSIEYTEFLLQQRRRQQDELDSLRKELVALQILKANYERLVEAHRCRPGHANAQISDELKFHVFRRILDRLFVTFDASVLVENFAELSGSMIGWMEEHVTPHELHQICLSVLAEVDS